jgi:hypothetical protein
MALSLPAYPLWLSGAEVLHEGFNVSTSVKLMAEKARDGTDEPA